MGKKSTPVTLINWIGVIALIFLLSSCSSNPYGWISSVATLDSLESISTEVGQRDVMGLHRILKIGNVEIRSNSSIRGVRATGDPEVEGGVPLTINIRFVSTGTASQLRNIDGRVYLSDEKKELNPVRIFVSNECHCLPGSRVDGELIFPETQVDLPAMPSISDQRKSAKSSRSGIISMQWVCVCFDYGKSVRADSRYSFQVGDLIFNNRVEKVTLNFFPVRHTNPVP